MAMRPKGVGGAPRRGAQRGGVQPVYEDFKPTSEWQQDDESHILKINLPGFMQGQIKVSTKGQQTIRVHGERLVAGNKWSRFLEDFQVPDDGEMNGVRAIFQGGLLTITVPKKKVDKLHETPLTPKPKGNDVQKQPATITSQPADQKQKTTVDPTIKQGQDTAFPAVGSTSQSAVERSLESQKASGDYRDKEKIEKEKKNTATERTGDNLTSKMVDNETNKKAVVLPAKKKAPEIDGATGNKKELYGAAITKEKYKKAVKGLTELNEERQLLVNMGVAMLVVVALTAYVTYKFASGKDKK